MAKAAIIFEVLNSWEIELRPELQRIDADAEKMADD